MKNFENSLKNYNMNAIIETISKEEKRELYKLSYEEK
jgi:hypothetical protein